MKNIIFFVVLSLSFVSCRNEKNKAVINSEGQLVLNFEAQSSSSFFSDRIFGKVEMTPLETAEKCLVGAEPVIIILDTHHFFIQDYQQQVIFRFDRTGRFINQIGRLGKGPGEYVAILNYDVNPMDNVVEILAPAGQIMRYSYDGTFISNQNYDTSLISFIKTGTHYWFYTHKITGKDRLMKISEDGTVIAEFLPSKTDWIPIQERNFEQCGNMITFRETFSHTVYRIIDEGPIETAKIDFGKYAIPKNMYDRDLTAAYHELTNKGWAMIHKVLENEQFVYIFFYVRQTNKPDDYYHWLINKKTGSSVLQKFSPDNLIYDMMKESKALTVDNKLIFMADAQMLKACTDPFFSNANSIRESLSEESNPVIISLQINNF